MHNKLPTYTTPRWQPNMAPSFVFQFLPRAGYERIAQLLIAVSMIHPWFLVYYKLVSIQRRSI